METFVYYPKGVCSRRFEITYDGDTIIEVKILDGCRGNSQAVTKLLQGMKIEEAINRLEGIMCRGNTSCPDQISKALQQILTKE